MLFKEFFGLSQIWTTSDSNNRMKWVENDSHVTKSNVRPYSGNEKKLWTSCLENTTTNVWSFGFQILKKANDVWTSWDLLRSHDIICGGYGKKLRMFRIICHVRCLQTEISQKKNHSVVKDSVRFGVKETIKLGWTSKLFI